jgi:superfamily II RNA helicase
MILSLLRVKDFEMEDMMRSSFAEFHLQKKQPELASRRSEAEATLRQLREKPWPVGPGRFVTLAACLHHKGLAESM